MANTQVNAALREKKFRSDFFREYVRTSRFSRYTGTGADNVITIKEDRKQIVIPLVTKLKGTGVTGSATLRGNGENIGNYDMTLTPSYFRHAVEFDKEEMEKPAIDLMEAARPLLMDWAKELQRDQTIQALGAVYNGTTYANYGDATAGNLDTWNTNNGDRILYGAAKSNRVAGDHTASLANVDTTNDKATAAMVSLAKRMAQQSLPKIRPLMSQEDEEQYVLFCDPYVFRNLKTDTTITQAQREGWTRGKDNPLFSGGDLLWDNVIIREIPEIAELIDGTSGTNGKWGGLATADSLATGGNSSTRVGVAFLCGQQAVGYGLGQRPSIVVDRDFDYGFQPGVAVELKHELRKAFFNSVQHGVLTVFSSAARDS